MVYINNIPILRTSQKMPNKAKQSKKKRKKKKMKEERKRITSKTKEKEEKESAYLAKKYHNDANEENIPGARGERSPAKWQ